MQRWTTYVKVSYQLESPWYQFGRYRLVMTPDSKVHGANMGPIWGQQDPGGPHVGLMNFAIWDGWCRNWRQIDIVANVEFR